MSRYISAPAIHSSESGAKPLSRAWDREIKLPLEDRNLHLCARHRVMDLKRSDFAARPHEQSLPPDWHFGTLWEVIQRSDYCVFCELIAKSVSTTAYQREAEVLGCWIQDVTYTEEDAQTGIAITMVTLRLRILPEMVAWEDAFAPFDIVPLTPENEDGMFLGKRLDAKSIDISLLKTWLRTCEDWHNIVCWRKESPSEGPKAAEIPIQPFIRLLDLKDNCLIQTSTPPVFVALSYVWGQVKVFKTLNQTLSDLMRPGSLEKISKSFPKTIQDAITLTCLLEHRYLWIDSICIIQDNDSDKGNQLQLMDTIYTRASFTIVAAGGQDANAGLPGIKEGSRSIVQHTATYSDQFTLLSLFPDCEDAVHTSTWNGRGWTYQERILSRRLLFFTKDTVYFQCGQATRSEDFNMLRPNITTSASQQMIVLSRGEELPTLTRRNQYRLGLSMEYYFRMVTEYTSRDMTYPSDRLRGFEGILNVLRQPNGPVFVWGIWTGNKLANSLLWQPRQELERISIDEKTKAPMYPSWSWAGWAGAVKYDDPLDWNGLPALNDPCDQALPSKYGVSVNLDSAGPMYHLRLRTRIASFRLTMHDRSGALKPPSLPEVRGPHPTRFGITTVQSTEEPWLGTIMLPTSYRQKLSTVFEFVILSDAYGFSGEELSMAAARALEPYSAVNVMLIMRQDTHGSENKSVVIRVGVGRMLKEAWNEAQDCWEDILVA